MADETPVLTSISCSLTEDMHPHILVVNSNPNHQQIVVNHLVSQQYQVTHTTNSLYALEVLEEDHSTETKRLGRQSKS